MKSKRKNLYVKYLLFVLLALFSADGMAKDYKYKSVSEDKMKTRIYTLDNGLKVYLSVNTDKPRIQTYIAVKTGSRNDPAETTGLAHYLEHIMFKGTKQFGTRDYEKEKYYLDNIEKRYEVYRNVKDEAIRRQLYHEIDSVSQLAAQYNIPNEYDKLMASIGSEGSNAYTSNDVTCYVENIPANEVEKWARIQSDRFQNMQIRGFHTELEAVYEEYNMGLTSDGRKQWNALMAKLFPAHPYGTQTTIGTQEHLKNPSITNIKNYYNRYYCPNNVAICMAGDFDPDKVIALVDKYFGEWKTNKDLSFPEYAPVADLTAPADTTVIGNEAENILMAWKFDKAASLQSDTLSVLSSIMYNGVAGLMDIDLGQKMKYNEGGAFYDTMAEYSLFLMEGYPKEGQSLEEVRNLLLAEIEKVKKGEFSEELLLAVINNMKLDHAKSLESNERRASKFVDAFIYDIPWKQEVEKLDRMAALKKEDIMAFANRHFQNNYVSVFKKIGTDESIKKIEKPSITPIPANREMQSQFVTDIINTKTDPISPKFVDFEKDLEKGKVTKNMPLLYVANKENDRFELVYRFNMGSIANKWLPFAAGYLDYVGTETLSAEELRMKFYKLACNFSVKVSNDLTTITLSGLTENMAEGITLLEEVLTKAKGDNESYDAYVSIVEKNRSDSKLGQSENFSALRTYAFYGKNNALLNQPSTKQLGEKEPQQLLKALDELLSLKHTVLYYGPTPIKEVATIVGKTHCKGRSLSDIPVFKDYALQKTERNEVFIAPYDAKNIYMVQYHNEGRQWKPENQAVVELFNEYFGGGMNTVVFQELRETRGLAYSASAYYNTPQKKNVPEYVNTYIISQNDKMIDCINTFQQIIDTIPQSVKDFNLAKQSLTKKLQVERTQKMDIIRAYLNAERLGIDYDINRVVYQKLPSIRLTDLVNFEKETMAEKPYRYIILGNKKELDIKALEKIGPIKYLSTEEIFGY